MQCGLADGVLVQLLAHQTEQHVKDLRRHVCTLTKILWIVGHLNAVTNRPSTSRLRFSCLTEILRL